MQTLTLHPPATAEHCFVLAPPRVFIDGQRRYDLHVLTWNVAPLPDLGIAILRADTPTPAALPCPGQPVCITAPAGGANVIFHGRVARHRQHLNDTETHWVAELQHELHHRLDEPLVGRWHTTAEGPAFFNGAPVRFNTSVGMQASRQRFLLNGRLTRLFAESSDAAQPWTVADALTYLLAVALPASAFAPGPAELLEMGLGTALAPYNANAVTVGHALAETASRSGVAWRTARSELGLVAYRPGQDGRRTRLRLQPAGQTLDPVASNVQAVRITTSQRPARREIQVLGQPRRHEATFTLQPGWDPDLAAGLYDEYVRSGAGSFTAVEPVFRKWVLNEHGAYDAAPFNLARYDAAELSPADFTHAHPRRFLPCISRDDAGESRGLIIEYRLGETDTWRQWGGAAWTSDTQCAVYFDDDALDADYVAAAAAGTAQVRITASIEADRALTFTLVGDRRQVTDVRRAPTGEHWTVHPSSIFFAELLASPGQSAIVVRDDSPALVSLAQRIRASDASGLHAEVTLPWPHLSLHVGDRTDAIEGRQLPLVTRPGACPVVTRVRHNFDGQPQSHIEMEA